ncbi:tail fiber domain-containing protein [Salmonella enterica]|nr:tail fiber domain-containing protein [Salmonella enterica]
MPIDDRTTRFDLELPAQANTLKNDVERLRDSMSKLDQNAAKLGPDAKLLEEQLPASVARLTSAGLLKEDQIPPVVPLLDTNNKLPEELIPEAARMNTLNAASEVLMLDLVDATLGDVCNITVAPYKQYLLVKTDPTQRDSWRELPQAAVTSVNGATGDVTVAEAGANTNITSLEGLTGPTRLGGDAATDYDAVTLRQLRSASGIGQGANMNGVMNNFIGAIEWFNGSRAALPAGYIAADGQLASRTDAATADLWTAVNSGMYVSTTTDALWIDSGIDQARANNRGMYSPGDGSTNFRIPDLNSQFNDVNKNFTPQGLFLRSSGRLVGNGVGNILENATPNIIGVLRTVTSSSLFESTGGATGAFSGSDLQPYANLQQTAGAASGYPRTIKFDASTVNKAYGRFGSGEVRPNAALGIWIIRASGAFQAANTSFSVANSDANTPAAGVIANGGRLISTYEGYAVGKISSSFRSSLKIGLDVSTTVIFTDATGINGTYAQFSFDSDGRFNAPKANIEGEFFAGYARINGDIANNFSGNTFSNSIIQYTQSDAGDGTKMRGSAAHFTYGGDHVISNFSSLHDNKRCTIYADGGYLTRAGLNGAFSMNAFNVGWDNHTASLFIDQTPMTPVFTIPSDRILKDHVEYVTNADQALAEVNAYRVATFNYKARGIMPESDQKLGFIANDMREISPDIITGKGLDDSYDGINHLDAYQIDSVGLLAKLVQSIQALTARVAELEAKA